MTSSTHTCRPRANLLLQATAVCLCSTLALACVSVHAQSLNGNPLVAPFAESAGPGVEPPERRNQDAAKAQQPAEKPRRLAPNVAPSEAARRARHEYGGRVLNVVLEDGPGGPYYRVKLLDGGRVRIVHVEARD